jgi:signal transduction histidine kinase
MCVFGENNRVIAINPAASTLFESASIPIEIGTSTEQFNAIVPHWSEIIQQLRKSPVAVRLTTRLMTKSGVRVVEIITTEVLDHEQHRIGVGVLLSDLTDELVAAEDRARKERLSSLGEMAAGLAHQLRNSLGAIRGFASLVKRRVAPENQSHVDQLLAEGREAEELITRFLVLSRPLELQVVKISVESLLRDAISGFEVRAREQGIDLVCNTGSDTMMEADPLLLKQAFGNLIDNALLHTTHGGKIQLDLHLSTMESRVEIKIVDSGSGIPAEILPKLFTPFYSTRPSGTGLGLAFVRKVIEMHAGEVQIESQPGEGTTVTISLPVLHPQSAESTPQPEYSMSSAQ